MIPYSMEDNSCPVAVTVDDSNHDNKSDIVVVNSETDNLCILLGYGNESFPTITICSTGFRSHPCAVALGDFNKDHVLDIIVLNAGTNQIFLLRGYRNGTFIDDQSYIMDYNPDPYAVADFNGDDWLDIAVANYGESYC